MPRCTSAIPYFLHSLLKLAQPLTTYRDLTTGINDHVDYLKSRASVDPTHS